MVAAATGLAGWLAAQLPKFNFRQQAVSLLGAGKDSFHQLRGGLDAPLLQPIDHIRFPAHGANFNFLLQSEPVGRNAGIDLVGQFHIVLPEGLDDGGGVDARAGAKGIGTHDGVVRRNAVPYFSPFPTNAPHKVTGRGLNFWPAVERSAGTGR